MKLIKPAILLGLFLIYGCTSHETIDLPDGKLITTDFFQGLKTLPDDMIFVDCRLNENFKDAHIPDAINIWRREISDSLGLKISAQALFELLGKKGVNNNSTLIIYDSGDASEASRLWWLLDCYGFDSTYILEGGFEKWKSVSLPISTAIANRSSQVFNLSDPGKCALLAEKGDVLNALVDNSIILLDVRSDDEYYSHMAADLEDPMGHIPSSFHMDYINNLVSDSDGTLRFKSIPELKKQYEALGIDEDSEVIIYCHSGVRSSQTILVLSQILGYKKVRNYDGSWKEWSGDSTLPIEHSKNFVE